MSEALVTRAISVVMSWISTSCSVRFSSGVAVLAPVFTLCHCSVTACQAAVVPKRAPNCASSAVSSSICFSM